MAFGGNAVGPYCSSSFHQFGPSVGAGRIPPCAKGQIQKCFYSPAAGLLQSARPGCGVGKALRLNLGAPPLLMHRIEHELVAIVSCVAWAGAILGRSHRKKFRTRDIGRPPKSTAVRPLSGGNGK